jgi:hypothetical protein
MNILSEPLKISVMATLQAAPTAPGESLQGFLKFKKGVTQ